jgi:hypothetical protein
MSTGFIDHFLTASSKAAKVANWMTYFAVEQLAWLGPADYLLKLVRHLKLKFNKKYHGPHSLHYSKVPFTYIWSPALVPRPDDWPSTCEVVGFVNLDLKQLTSYTPPKEISDFLAAGPPPIYVGFGSLVVDNPAKLTRRFLKAIMATNQRAIIQKGWGGLGAGVEPGQEPEGVLFIGPAAHDWLFPRCAAVVHHGGAGTTACGLYCGKPTFIVPFFGDQPFWGAACFRAGVGPAPVTIDELTSKKIIDAFEDLIKPERTKRAEEIQARMLKENGAEGAADHIHRSIYGALLGNDSDLPWLQESYAKQNDNVYSKSYVYTSESVPGSQHHPVGVDSSSGLPLKHGNKHSQTKSTPGSFVRGVFSSSSSGRNESEANKADSVEAWSNQINPHSELTGASSTNPFGTEMSSETARSPQGSVTTPAHSIAGLNEYSKYHEVQFVIGSDRMTGKVGGLFMGSVDDFIDNTSSVSKKALLTFKKWGGIGAKWLHFAGGVHADPASDRGAKSAYLSGKSTKPDKYDPPLV